MNAGRNNFQWKKTAAHRTADWRYFITKPDWNPNLPLSRASFDLAPFCVFSGGNQQPSPDTTHECFVPERDGYHVILGVWDVGDTANSFYNVIDAQFGGTNPEQPTTSLRDIGDINSGRTLRSGTEIKLRLFSAQGELTQYDIAMRIQNDEEGAPNRWPELLARRIHALNEPEITAGILNADGSVTPRAGRNDIFVPQSSNITRAEIDIDIPDMSALTIGASVSQTQYEVDAGERATILVSLAPSEEMNVSAELFKDGVLITSAALSQTRGGTLELGFSVTTFGRYDLIVKGETSLQEAAPQSSFTLEFNEKGMGTPVPPGETVTVYPAGRGSYVVGSNVTGFDGGEYRCTVATWCNSSPTYYAPGTGLAWETAWSRIATGTPPASEATMTYPEGRGDYDAGSLVLGQDGEKYRCIVAAWCNSGSDQYYVPGAGLAWQSAWSKIDD